MSYTKNLNKLPKELSKSLDLNIEKFTELFKDDETFVNRLIENQRNNAIRGCVLFFTGMVNKEIISENIIQPFIQNTALVESLILTDFITRQVFAVHQVEKSSDMIKIIDSLYNGYCVFLLEGSSDALIINCEEWKTRAIEEPQTEKVLSGPREGFTESLSLNLSLIKKRLRTPDLKLKFKILGEKTNTKICICYVAGIANEKILNELNLRLDKINIDAILDSAYIQELIKDSPYSPFKTIGTTERPDVVVAKLLEGRIALVVEGTPVAITVPYIFMEYFQSNDDYYLNFYFATIGRMIRILGFITTISVPAIYISLVTYHQEVIPTQLLFNISAARDGVPLPTVLEAFGMLLVFEILRETGLRMPSFIGQALSIVGALVIGQAAVEARFISAPMVIIVAYTGITGLIVPKIKGAVILIRLIFIVLAGILGLYGIIFGVSGLLIHLFELRSFGVPFMYKLMFLNPGEDIKDTAIRAPWWFMKYRPGLISQNRIRNVTKRDESP